MGAGGDRGEGGEMVWGRVWLVGEKPSPQRESSDESINPSTITREAVGSMAEVVTFRGREDAEYYVSDIYYLSPLLEILVLLRN